jgi:hypothetical protein
MNHVGRIKRESSSTEKLASIAVGSDMKAIVYISQPCQNVPVWAPDSFGP